MHRRPIKPLLLNTNATQSQSLITQADENVNNNIPSSFTSQKAGFPSSSLHSSQLKSTNVQPLQKSTPSQLPNKEKPAIETPYNELEDINSLNTPAFGLISASFQPATQSSCSKQLLVKPLGMLARYSQASQQASSNQGLTSQIVNYSQTDDEVTKTHHISASILQEKAQRLLANLAAATTQSDMSCISDSSSDGELDGFDQQEIYNLASQLQAQTTTHLNEGISSGEQESPQFAPANPPSPRPKSIQKSHSKKDTSNFVGNRALRSKSMKKSMPSHINEIKKSASQKHELAQPRNIALQQTASQTDSKKDAPSLVSDQSENDEHPHQPSLLVKMEPRDSATQADVIANTIKTKKNTVQPRKRKVPQVCAGRPKLKRRFHPSSSSVSSCMEENVTSDESTSTSSEDDSIEVRSGVAARFEMAKVLSLQGDFYSDAQIAALAPYCDVLERENIQKKQSKDQSKRKRTQKLNTMIASSKMDQNEEQAVATTSSVSESKQSLMNLLHEAAKQDESLAYKLAFGRPPPVDNLLYGVVMPHEQGDWQAKFFTSIDAERYYAERGFGLYYDGGNFSHPIGVETSHDSDSDWQSTRALPRHNTRRKFHKRSAFPQKVQAINNPLAIEKALLQDAQQAAAFSLAYAKETNNQVLLDRSLQIQADLKLKEQEFRTKVSSQNRKVKVEKSVPKPAENKKKRPCQQILLVKTNSHDEEEVLRKPRSKKPKLQTSANNNSTVKKEPSHVSNTDPLLSMQSQVPASINQIQISLNSIVNCPNTSHEIKNVPPTTNLECKSIGNQEYLSAESNIDNHSPTLPSEFAPYFESSNLHCSNDQDEYEYE